MRVRDEDPPVVSLRSCGVIVVVLTLCHCAGAPRRAIVFGAGDEYGAVSEAAAGPLERHQK